MSRAHADVYLGSWLALISGQAAAIVQELSQRWQLAEVSAEAWLRMRLEAAGVPVMFFPGTAFVVCSKGGLPSRSIVACSRGRRYKHGREYRTAVRAAGCLSADGVCAAPSSYSASAAYFQHEHSWQKLDGAGVWTGQVLGRCLSCVQVVMEHWAHSSLRRMIAEPGLEARRRAASGNLRAAAVSLMELAVALRSFSSWHSASSAAMWVPVPVPAPGCAGYASGRLGRAVLRRPRSFRLVYAAAVLDTFASMLLHLVSQRSRRKLCVLWLHAVALVER
eukprot:gnl/TRDRNA2_/TRDRNA2_164697_c0_seq1.p1 gnl/TRDRNA2_/TRDRNA2_164697_c0~~gnl/TRDRNA2_/TRDRNA2_164697_c0_seq1.p1  ORF type:complete len:290 (+),score=36.57 gnl/TRDRNA2_/TRDRNA2_164697_c0_seq1:39-872(+)